MKSLKILSIFLLVSASHCVDANGDIPPVWQVDNEESGKVSNVEKNSSISFEEAGLIEVESKLSPEDNNMLFAMRMIGEKEAQDLQAYAKGLGISVEAANAFYTASKSLMKRFSVESELQHKSWCKALLSHKFSGQIKSSDIEMLKTRLKASETAPYNVIIEGFDKLEQSYPEEYSIILDSVVAADIREFEKDDRLVTPEHWVEFHVNSCTKES